MSTPALVQEAERAHAIECVEIDLLTKPEPPRWIWRGYLERGLVAMLAADTGVGKSLVVAALMAAIVKREPLLGEPVTADRVLLIDRENGVRMLRGRLRGMLLGGPGNEDRMQGYAAEFAARCRVSPKTAGGPITLASLEAAIVEHRPDVAFIDTMMVALPVEDVASNTEAAKLMSRVSRLTATHDATIVLLHHERKQDRQHGGLSYGQEALGARQFLGQSEAMLRLIRGSKDREELEGGGYIGRNRVRLAVEKLRDGIERKPLPVVIESEYAADGTIVWSRLVEDESGGVPSATQELCARVAGLLEDLDEPARRADIAKQLGVTVNSTLDDALRYGVGEGVLTKVGRGLYEAAVEGPSEVAI